MLRLVKRLSPPRRPPLLAAAPPSALTLHFSSSPSDEPSPPLSPPPPPSPSPSPPSKPLPPSHLNPVHYARLLSRRSSPSSSSSPLAPSLLSYLRGGCHDPSSPPPPLPLCPGCGIHMQDTSSSSPGFFSPPSTKSPDYRAPLDRSHPLTTDEAAVSFKSGLAPDPTNNDNPGNPSHSPLPLVCARCHSLRHYGKVKHPSAENLLPDFDFDRMVAPKMVSPSGPRSVVLMIADAADFDGSFPRKVARIVSTSAETHYSAWKEGKPANIARTVLVVTKIDILPSSIDPAQLGSWVRQRAHFGGAGTLAGVHLVSAVRGWGVRDLVDHVRQRVGVRGNVWAVGAQNVGKSTLLNAMAKCVGEKLSCLTEAPVPGTTLGIVRVEGVLGGQAKLFDTPGILHPYQIGMRLTREEQKLVHMSKELRPRTYRIKAGYSVHIAGLLRVDLEESSVDSVYLTVWASPLLPLHMGKTEHASAMVEDHFGRQLQPPIGEKRSGELGKWERTEFSVCGNSWDDSSVDIAAAGLGWVAIALKGEANLGVWTYEGIGLVSRSSLVPNRARIFEEAGFTVSKIVSQADSALNKLKPKAGKKQQDSNVKPSDSPPISISW